MINKINERWWKVRLYVTICGWWAKLPRYDAFQCKEEMKETLFSIRHVIFDYSGSLSGYDGWHSDFRSLEWHCSEICEKLLLYKNGNNCDNKE